MPIGKPSSGTTGEPCSQPPEGVADAALRALVFDSWYDPYRGAVVMVRVVDGVLRNAGYDATHLGSSERYMAAIEKFVGEAEKNYRQRAGNVPGANA